MGQLPVGALRATELNLRRSIELGVELQDEFHQAVEHKSLGQILNYRGNWDEFEKELNLAYSLFVKLGSIQSQSVVMFYQALRGALMTRDSAQSIANNTKSAMQFAHYADWI